MLTLNYEEILQRYENGTLEDLMNKSGISLGSVLESLFHKLYLLDEEVKGYEDQEYTYDELSDQVFSLEVELTDLTGAKEGLEEELTSLKETLKLLGG